MDSRIFVFSQDHMSTLKLFNHTLIKKHAHVASIERLSQSKHPDLGFYSYNFFHSTVGGNPAILNHVWHFGDTVDDHNSLFTDLKTFHNHNLESMHSIHWVIIE